MRFALSIAGWVGFVLFAAGCSPGDSQSTVKAPGGAGAAAAAAAAADPREGTLFNLEARHGAPDALWIQAGWKIRREVGVLSKTLEVKIEHAPPSTSHVLTLDGFTLGKVTTSSKGKAEFELVASGDDSFPDGFVEPGDGSVLRVGELADLRLQTVHKLTDLQLDIAGPGALSGKIGYKVERIGDAVTTEFQIKVTKAEVKSTHPVLLDGVHVGDLVVDLAGKGKLLYSDVEGEPFPPAFQAPHAGSTVEVGKIYKGELHDNLVEHGQ